jgi:hypothetical protein
VESEDAVVTAYQGPELVTLTAPTFDLGMAAAVLGTISWTALLLE